MRDAITVTTNRCNLLIYKPIETRELKKWYVYMLFMIYISSALLDISLSRKQGSFSFFKLTYTIFIQENFDIKYPIVIITLS